jgi:hypothetical protein
VRLGYWQVDAIIRTESSFSFGMLAFDVVPAGDSDGVALAFGSSTVPEISTLCPTCGVSFASSASSRYSVTGAPVLVLPVVPVAAGLLIAAFVSRNFVSAEFGVAPVVPAVAVGASVARWTQPVTVTFFGDMLLWGDGELCAATTVAKAIANAAHAPDHSFSFRIVTS